ncbi:MAG: extracellular solute-binding protein [Propionibacteriaceae bacterium]|nr:extracellular solute-binding protein [Propionibacteriaceae bacterium]
MAKRYVTYGLVGLTVATMALAGCSSTPSPSPSSEAPGAPEVVTIYGTPTGNEGSQWEASWQAWAAANNIDIQYTGDRDFTTNISTKIQGNSLPDIAVFPQPGLMKSVIQTGKVQPLDPTTLATLQQNFSADWQAYGTVDGQQYAVPLDASAKGYIWYSPSAFEQWGVTVPKTWDDLMTLTDTIQQKVSGPVWCAGFNSGDSSGWPGTDQIAEYLLSASGGDVYDQWVSGDVKFTDQPVADAFSALGKLWLDPKYVNAGFGGVDTINSTAFGDVAIPLANGQCALTNQATFLEASFADAKTAAGTTPKVAPDGDIWAFMMPPVAGTQSVVGGGDFAVAFTSSPAVQKVMNYLASGDYANSLITVSGATFITANKGVDVSKEADPLLAQAIQTLTDTNTTFRFGAGDTMPSVVQQAWWKGTVDWLNGASQTSVLSQIQASWADA